MTVRDLAGARGGGVGPPGGRDGGLHDGQRGRNHADGDGPRPGSKSYNLKSGSKTKPGGEKYVLGPGQNYVLKYTVLCGNMRD